MCIFQSLQIILFSVLLSLLVDVCSYPIIDRYYSELSSPQIGWNWGFLAEQPYVPLNPTHFVYQIEDPNANYIFSPVIPDKSTLNKNYHINGRDNEQPVSQEFMASVQAAIAEIVKEKFKSLEQPSDNQLKAADDLKTGSATNGTGANAGSISKKPSLPLSPGGVWYLGQTPLWVPQQPIQQSQFQEPIFYNGFYNGFFNNYPLAGPPSTGVPSPLSSSSPLSPSGPPPMPMFLPSSMASSALMTLPSPTELSPMTYNPLDQDSYYYQPMYPVPFNLMPPASFYQVSSSNQSQNQGEMKPQTSSDHSQTPIPAVDKKIETNLTKINIDPITEIQKARMAESSNGANIKNASEGGEATNLSAATSKKFSEENMESTGGKSMQSNNDPPKVTAHSGSTGRKHKPNEKNPPHAIGKHAVHDRNLIHKHENKPRLKTLYHLQKTSGT